MYAAHAAAAPAAAQPALAAASSAAAKAKAKARKAPTARPLAAAPLAAAVAVVEDSSGGPGAAGANGSCHSPDPDCAFSGSGTGGDAPAAPTGGAQTLQYAAGTALAGDGSHAALLVRANGGSGGKGGDAHGGGLAPVWHNGGAAAAGGAAGTLTLGFDPGSSATSGNGSTATVQVIASGGQGGTGGNGGNFGSSGANGDGGTGGVITLHNNADSITNSSAYNGSALAPAAIQISSSGGNGGGPGGGAATSSDSATGKAGGAGGDGGSILYLSVGATAGAITSSGSGIVVVSQGGHGGDGAEASAEYNSAKGGVGGAGGSGGTATVSLATTATLTGRGVDGAGTAATIIVDPNNPAAQAASSFVSAGVLVQSLGGQGGSGGSGNGSFGPGSGGGGGAAGSGNLVAVYTSGTSISMSDYGASAIVGQSVGGSGGNGAGAGSAFGVKGGNGGAAGAGRLVVVETDDRSDGNGHALIRTTGDDATVVIAQSIGGGGGNGASVRVSTLSPVAISLGGNAEQGGDGGQVQVQNGSIDPDSQVLTPGAVISSKGLRSAGMLAQSIGGGGGVGGSASASAIGGFVSLSIGGVGGKGGDAVTRDTGGTVYTQVTANNYGVIQTEGQHSRGIDAQAIGGGGGAGGAASSVTVGGQITMASAVGGNGGKGGDAGPVVAYNQGQINTLAANSAAISVQSVGGGGGHGGASWTETLQAVTMPDTPSVNMTVTIGGIGGTGGDGGSVHGTNAGSIITQGGASNGLFAQSVGGGGGDGGDAGNRSIGVENSNVNAHVVVGGNGGTGGVGGSVLADNTGFMMTQGFWASGIVAQSIGGGGGMGGLGKTDTASLLSDNKAVEFSLAMGGVGGSGGIGGDVTVNNTGGSILTMGNLSNGIFAQSVGGGGGAGAAGNAGGSGGTVSVNIGIGGAGGSGNHGGTVNVNNTGAIMTTGAASAAIYAQSIGGGGGSGGGATAGGGTDPELTVTDYLAGTVGIGTNVTKYSDGIYGFAHDQLIGDGALKSMTTAFQNYVEQNPPGAPFPEPEPNPMKITSLDVGGANAGKGGAGGDGNAVSVVNAGSAQILTLSPGSEGIYAQSVGGGGGDGGAAQASNNPQGFKNADGKSFSAAFGIGGKGGSAGEGGLVTVINNGSIETDGAFSAGVFAQSVGGGGGKGGATASSWQQIEAVNFQLGGDGGSNGDGGNVTVQFTDRTHAAIVTRGNASAGILAHSIGGGGGVGMLGATVPNTGGGQGQSDVPLLPVDFTPAVITLHIGGDDGEANCGATGRKAAGCGNGSLVEVDAADVSTAGTNSHGIVAQSIGGGGGAILGAPASGNAFFGGNAMVGNGGEVRVSVGINGPNDHSNDLMTTGGGAYGIIAQSIGGGGLLAGDLSTAAASATGPKFTANTASDGTGGDVSVNVYQSAWVRTTGANAHAIFAQSVGGGGGLVASSDTGLLMGTAGGSGNSGNVVVNNYSYVQATGAGSSAIFVNADGQAGNTGTATVNSYNTVWGNSSAPAIVFSGNGHGTLNNTWFIANTNGTAVEARGTSVDVHNTTALGQIYGNLNLGPNGTLDNQALWATNDQSTISKVNNQGTINIWGANYDQMADSRLTGNLVSSGTLHSRVDFQNQVGGKLVVSGSAALTGGVISLTAATMAPKPVTVLSAGTLSVDPSVTVRDDSAAQLFTYMVDTSGNAITVTPFARFSQVAAAQRLSGAQRAVADHLQAGFVPGLSDTMAKHYAQVGALPSAQGYADQLDRLGNEASQSVGTAIHVGSIGFVERMNSCPQFEGGDGTLRERDCLWSRADGQRVHRSGSGKPLGYAQENYQVQFGGQRGLGNGWFIGGSFGYDTSRLTTGMAHAVSGHGVTAGLVAKREVGDWLFSGAVNIGRGSYDSRRQITLGTDRATAEGSFDATHVGLHGRISRHVTLDSWYLKPYVDVHATRLRTGGYQETGADELGLLVRSESDTVFAVSPMLEVGKRLDLANGMRLRGLVAVGFTNYSRNDWSAQSRFSGAAAEAGAFRSTAELPSTRLKLRIGANLYTAQAVDLKLEYTGEHAHGYHANAGTLKFSYLF
ncbi:hypothetical protein V4F39_11405 [Aquincola sp. MAHUQ-54]|uniref:Autotransporter domain-containing protein n=1 Tax=Aquincola agrisoli TaxID=3119538 RepID=A0AAW9Q3V7_9BURK